MDIDDAGLQPDTVIEADTDVGTIWLDKGGHILTDALIKYGSWDPAISGLIRTALSPGMTFVDAGANIGYFSILASSVVGPTGRVFAVEPDPANRRILEANLARTGSSNVTVLPYAAWDSRTELNLIQGSEDGAVTRVTSEGDGGEKAGGLTPAARLDEVIDGPVHYMKVDCELTDHVVVRGSERLLTDNPEMLVSVEFHPWDDSHLGESPAEVLQTYQRLGLSPFAIGRDGTVVEPTTWEKVAAPNLAAHDIAFDFLLARQAPSSVPLGQAWPTAVGRLRAGLAHKGILKRAGDLLEHVPPAIRPPIRDRDRAARRERKNQK